MSYVERNLVPGETLLYQTRHHWVVLIGPLLIALLVGLPGLFLLFEVAAKRPEIYDYVTRMPGGAETLVVAGARTGDYRAGDSGLGNDQAQRHGNGGNQPPSADQDGIGQPQNAGLNALPGGKHRRP